MIMQGILISYTNVKIIVYYYTEKKKKLQNIKYYTIELFHDKEGDPRDLSISSNLSALTW